MTCSNNEVALALIAFGTLLVNQFIPICAALGALLAAWVSVRNGTKLKAQDAVMERQVATGQALLQKTDEVKAAAVRSVEEVDTAKKAAMREGYEQGIPVGVEKGLKQASEFSELKTIPPFKAPDHIV